MAKFENNKEYKVRVIKGKDYDPESDPPIGFETTAIGDSSQCPFIVYNDSYYKNITRKGKKGQYINEDNLELIEESSELSDLIKKANEGEEAQRKLITNYMGKYERACDGGIWTKQTAFSVTYNFREIKKPKFEPYKIGSWEVKLEDNVLYVGCTGFDAGKLNNGLKNLSKGRDSQYDLGKNNRLNSTRNGVYYNGDLTHSITWEQVDTLTKKLEDAGV